MHSSNGTPTRYPRAVGNQPQPTLGWSFLEFTKNFQQPKPLANTPESKKYWNAGVNMAYGRARAYPHKVAVRPAPVWGAGFMRGTATPGVEAYNRAKAHMDYGNPGAARAELGNFFDDVMGAIVPGWDSRPDFLKNITVRPDADKILAAVHKVAPNAGADIVKAANKAGFGIYVNTPGGQIEVSPTNAQNFYGMYPFISRAQGAVGSVPMWVWIAGGVGILGFFFLRR